MHKSFVITPPTCRRPPNRAIGVTSVTHATGVPRLPPTGTPFVDQRSSAGARDRIAGKTRRQRTVGLTEWRVVLLTITTTAEPASDLGFLLHKHPGRVQTFEVSVGTAENRAERIRAAFGRRTLG